MIFGIDNMFNQSRLIFLNIITLPTNRIFRDYGNIPGLDLAFIKNGYVYHTDADTTDRIPDGSIQRSGDNILAAVTFLAKTSDLELGRHGDIESPPVFFDMFGLFVISYPSWVGIIINLTVAFAALVIMYIDILQFSKKTDLSKVIN